MRHSRSDEAQRDIEDIIRESLRLFGRAQARLYADVIDGAIALVADDPERPSSRARPELGEGVRSLHLEIAAGRRGAASHQVYYKAIQRAGEEPEVVVIRVLHVAMEPLTRITEASTSDRMSSKPATRS